LTVNNVKNPPSSSLPPQSAEPMITRLARLYEAGDVKRLHCVDTVRPRTIAEHVYGSMLIATELIKLSRWSSAALNQSVSYEAIISALLVHDAPEVETGDVPGPLKRRNEVLAAEYEKLEGRFYKDYGITFPQLGILENDIVAVSDSIDLAWLCLREMRLGNRTTQLSRVFRNIMSSVESRAHVAGVPDIYRHLFDQWRFGGGAL
jgi:5'-deoxynucleotidase YfbR-like HD superfamily hydrolase